MAAELPRDVLVLVHGDERAGRPIAAHPGVDLVLHTGSVATGRAIARACAGTGRKALLELGGKDALHRRRGGRPRVGGRAGGGGRVRQRRPDLHVGGAHLRRALAWRRPSWRRSTAWRMPGCRSRWSTSAAGGGRGHVEAAVAAGARVRRGGRRPERAGSFYPATVLEGCTDDMRVMSEETFGPVAAVRVVSSFDEAVAAANASDYGLAATVLTPSQERALRAADELCAGTVKVNAVWGGAPGGAAQPRGASGTGFGYGPELLDEVTTTKVVHFEPAP